MQALKSVFQRRAVFLGEDISPYLDFVGRSDAHESIVEGGVVDLAHGDAIRDDRLASLGVTTNVRGIKQFAMS